MTACPSLAGQLPGPPLKVQVPQRCARPAAGLAGQLPGPPLKADVEAEVLDDVDGLAGQLPGPPLKGPNVRLTES